MYRTLILLTTFISLSSIPVFTQADDQLIINGVAVPADFPFINHSGSDSTAAGKLFLTNYYDAPYILIMENDGTPYYYKRMDNQPTFLTKHLNGQLSRVLREGGRVTGFEIMDNNYQVVDSISAFGYDTDVHEFLITAEGHYLLIAREEKRMDLSHLIEGGDTNALVIGNHVQELDENKNLVFEWKSWDNYDIRDALHINLTARLVDYVHMNSIAVDYDGNLVVSCRHLCECTKINRQNGEIIWRLGGANNQFEFINDSLQPSWQHDIRPVPGKPDYYTLFDNGNHRTVEESRVVEYKVDTVNNTLTKIWEYRHPMDLYSNQMGNAQRLHNGNTLINFSNKNKPKIWEVTSQGEVVFQADYVRSNNCYRAFRHEWEGWLTEPYLVADRYSSVIRLVFNQFGDQDISHYNIYGGKEKSQLSKIDSTENTWFEINDLDTSGWYYFGITSVNGSGIESGFSNIDSTVIHFIEDGGNMILNGDFNSDSDFWDLEVHTGAEASGQVADGFYEAWITDGGTATEQIRLKQHQLPLVEGAEFTLQFEAYADQARLMEVGLERASYYPPLDYSKVGAIYITDTKKLYSFNFVMENQTDLRSMLVFDMGGEDGSVYIGNVSLIKVDSSKSLTVNDLDDDWPDEPVETESQALVSIYPIPASDQLMFRYNDPGICSSMINLYNLQGERVRSKTILSVTEGTEYMIWIENLAPGYYMCNIDYLKTGWQTPESLRYKISIAWVP